MKKLIFTLLVISIGTMLYSENKNYFFEQISPDYGLSHDGISSIIEDENGFLWYGSGDGVFYNNTSNTKKIELLRYDSLIISYPRVTKLYIDDKDQLWVCSFNGLFKFNQNENICNQVKLYTPDKKIFTNIKVSNILQIENDEYVILINEKCYRYNKNDSILSNLDDEGLISNRQITTIIKDKGNLILGSNKGEVLICRNIYSKSELLFSGKKSTITTICRDGNKYLIGYIDVGVDVINLDGKKINEYNRSNSVTNNEIVPFR